MKATGLMLGNLFREKFTGTIIEVIALDKETDSVTFSGSFEGEWQAEPILLTNETFSKRKYGLFPWGWVKEGFPLIRFSGVKYWVEIGNGHRIQLLYVHDLQNLETLFNLKKSK